MVFLYSDVDNAEVDTIVGTVAVAHATRTKSCFYHPSPCYTSNSTIEGVYRPPRLLRWSGHIGDIVLVSYGLRRRNMTHPELLLFVVV